MIEITPAILTDDPQEFKKQFEGFKNFHSVDIDIIRPPYINHYTLQLTQIIPLLNISKGISIGIHLMTIDPLKDITALTLNLNPKDLPLRIYFQQETEIKNIDYTHWSNNWIRAISLEIDTALESIHFYNNFSEVQFMSIPIGSQGQKFNPSVLKKIEKLRSMGYNGKISVDGGVNEESGLMLREAHVDRVSVGSYFSKSPDVKVSFEKLNKILNQ